MNLSTFRTEQLETAVADMFLNCRQRLIILDDQGSNETIYDTSRDIHVISAMDDDDSSMLEISFYQLSTTKGAPTRNDFTITVEKKHIKESLNSIM